SGREVIPAQFSTAADATVFREGIANVGATGGWTYIDGSGKFIVESQFWWAYPFSEGYACVLLPGEGAGYGFIDKTGRLLIKGLRAPSPFHDGLAPISVGSKWGYLGTDMQMAIPAQFDFAASFSEGMGPVQVGGKWGYIDKSGKIAVQPKYDITMLFRNGLGMVKNPRLTKQLHSANHSLPFVQGRNGATWTLTAVGRSHRISPTPSRFGMD